MDLNEYEVILFDAANTIMHKPALWDGILAVLKRNGKEISCSDLRKKHKWLSEVICFPDRTTRDFYKKFNKELFLSLGIIPSDTLLDEVFFACTYLPWTPFEDTKFLKQLSIDKAVLSNFNVTLNDTIIDLFGSDTFKTVIGSEAEGMAKPDIRFYEKAIERLKVKPENILFIGDSLKLDIIPAQESGMNAWLIDRDHNYPIFEKRLTSFSELL